MRVITIVKVILLAQLLMANNAFGAFGDIVKTYELGTDDSELGMLRPISIACGDGYLWILDGNETKHSEFYCTFYKCQEKITDGEYLAVLQSFDIKYYTRNDINGFSFVTENSQKYIWTTLTRCHQLNQLNLDSQYDIDTGVTTHRELYLPTEYWPTSITLDNNLNIYFLDGITRIIYKINYSVYQNITGHLDVSEGNIIQLFEVPESPLIPMGIQYILGIPGFFYITLAGENDYIIKVNMQGQEITKKDLHQQQLPEKISRMPTDLDIDSQGYIWFLDCDYDRLYRMSTS